MGMETIHSQIAEAGAQDVARHQAGVKYVTETAQAWAPGMIEAFDLHESPEEELGALLYDRMEAALNGIDYDVTSWAVVPHSYTRTGDGGWLPSTEHQAWSQLGWVICEQLPRSHSGRSVKPSYRLNATPAGLQLIDGWRAARGEVDTATQHEINRQRYRDILESIKQRRPLDSL